METVLANIACEKAARDFFATKKRTEFYDVYANDEDCGEAVYENKFSDEELKALRALEEKYDSMEWVKHLDEVFTDPDELHDLSCGEEVLGIDLDLPHYKYRFVCHQLDKDSLRKCEAYVELDDEAYIRLLTLCLKNPSLNMNSMKYADKKLYEQIMLGVDMRFVNEFGFYEADLPFLITMDEVMEDVKQILSVHPELKRETYSYYFRKYWEQIGVL